MGELIIEAEKSVFGEGLTKQEYIKKYGMSPSYALTMYDEKGDYKF